MEVLLKDIRYTLRTLLKNRGFAAVAILSIALGIGANTMIFSWVKAILLQPLPGVGDARNLAIVYGTSAKGAQLTTSYPDYLDYRDQNQAFSGLIAHDMIPISLSRDGKAERTWGSIVTGNYFSVLEVTPFLGRGFLPEEDSTPGAHPVAVVSYALWQRQLGADPNIVGEQITLNGNHFTVIGVTPRGFMGTVVGVPLDVWVPIMMEKQVIPAHDMLADRPARWLEVMGRLKPGVSLEQAQANLSTVARQLEQAYPAENQGVGVVLYSIANSPNGLQNALYAALIILTILVSLVLLIACANVANLLLSRAVARQKEIAIRIAVGVNRRNLIRQLLTESLVLSLLGGVIGLVLAVFTADLLVALIPPLGVPIGVNLNMDATVFIFAIGLSIVTGIIFGLVPAFQASNPNLVTALKDDSGGQSYRKARLRHLLLVSQIALSLILLIGAGLLIRSLRNAQVVDPGFNAENVLLLSVSPGLQGYDENRGRQFYEQLTDRVAALPGIESVSGARRMPLSATSGKFLNVFVEGYVPAPNEVVVVDYNLVGAGYFDTLGIPLLSGRDFGVQDSKDSTPSAIINERMAKRFWPDQDAVGKRFHIGAPQGPLLEIVGVAKTGKYYELGEQPRSYFYLPTSQRYQPDMILHVRTKGNPLARLDEIRSEIRRIDRDMPTYDAKTLRQHLDVSLFLQRMVATMLGGFGLLALTLAAGGLYGSMSYYVSQRRHEIGVRMALGAKQTDVLMLIVRQGLKVALIGIGIGLVAAFILSRLITSLLYGISAVDPVTFGATPLLLVLVALAATYVPARRAARVDPLIALRGQ